MGFYLAKTAYLDIFWLSSRRNNIREKRPLEDLDCSTETQELTVIQQ
jgi:hypothetical protein